jgi:hypothetical protein
MTSWLTSWFGLAYTQGDDVFVIVIVFGLVR